MTAASAATTQKAHSQSCSTCNLKELCMPVGLNQAELEQLDDLVSNRKKVAKGEALFHAGDAFSAFYAVRFGTFKTRITNVEGIDQVTGFQMAGEIVGLDGIGNNSHICDAVALEDSEVCTIPYERLDDISQQFHSLQTHFHRIMGREIVKDQNVMLLLGSMRAEQRLAAFLSSLSERQKARGFSAKDMVLRMTREEIGSYLGLKIETVSRTLSKMQADGLISIAQRKLSLLEPEKLRAIATNS